MKHSTNALTARYCASVGWPVETIQSWRGNKRHDAFGIADSMILCDGFAVLIQNCSYGTLKAHRDAIDAHPNRQAILASDLRLELWEWRRKKLKRGGKNKGREWYLRIQEADADGWDEVGPWTGPFDLYAKTTKT
jgi:hypothetical protein